MGFFKKDASEAGNPPKDMEEEDLRRLGEAEGCLERRDYAGAERVLRDVCSRCPPDYAYVSVAQGKRVIRAWDMEEFLMYVFMHSEDEQTDILCLKAVYPPACFRLGYLLMERGDPRGALHWLLLGAQMEPHRAVFLLEAGNAYRHCNDIAGALRCFEQVAAFPDLSPSERGAALRGMGVNYIDLGRLSDAERCLRESLLADPDNPDAVARAESELSYIVQLRSRGGGA